MTWLVLAGAVLLVVLVAFGAWGYQTANRLNRLNVRYDLSWQSLDSARATSGGGTCGGDRRVRRCPQGSRLAALADAAEGAPRHARENAENELSAALAMVNPASLPAALIAELADAEARVLLARRFHNDAVRDTLALGNDGWCDCCGLVEPLCCQPISRSSSDPTHWCTAIRVRPVAAPRRGWCYWMTAVPCCCCADRIRRTRRFGTARRRSGGSPSGPSATG